MNNVDSKTEENVVKGLVLDEKGNWITIAEKVARERVFLKHLEDGEVLYDGKWTKLDEKGGKAPSKSPIDPLLCIGAFTDLEETKELSSYIIKNVTKLISNKEIAKEDISGDSFITNSIIEAEEETKFLERFDLKTELENHKKRTESKSEYSQRKNSSFDCKTDLHSEKEFFKSGKNNGMDLITDNWVIEQKRNHVLVFSITTTATLIAIIAAIYLAFFL